MVGSEVKTLGKMPLPAARTPPRAIPRKIPRKTALFVKSRAAVQFFAARLRATRVWPATARESAQNEHENQILI